MSIKIVATGDIHIGQRISGLPDNVEEFSARDAWKRLVEWSIANNADVVVLTGDIVDRDNRFFEAIGRLQSGFSKLKEKGIQVYAVAGNHDFDVLPQIIQSGTLDNVHLLGEKGIWELEEFRKGKEVLQFAGWSFPSQFVLQDPLESFKIKSINKNIPCIGLLHGDVNVQGSQYAPVSLDKLKKQPVNTWILGHIHKPQVFSETPFICYPGSPIAFNSKETGLHGPLLFTVGNGSINKPERILTSPVRFANIEIDISGSTSEELFRRTIVSSLSGTDKLLEKELQDVSYLVYNINLTGVHNNAGQVKSWSEGLINDFEHETGALTKIVVRKVGVNVSPEIQNLEELAKQNTPVGMLARIITAINQKRETGFLTQILNDWKEKYHRVNDWQTYSPLKKTGESEDITEMTGKKYILKESVRLLGELLQQKN